MLFAAALACQLALSPAAFAAPPASFQVAAANPDGLDLNDDAGIAKDTHARTGHARFTKAQLAEGLGRLGADQVAEYKAVRGEVSDPAARVQLDALVAKHRVSYRGVDGKTILDHLKQIADGPTTHGIRAGQLLTDTIQDLARPSTIDQAAHGTCTATSIQAALARRNPGEYARIVAGLGTGDGTAKAHDGRTELSSANYVAFKDRTTSSNLMQPAIMEAEAEVEGGHYDNRHDCIVNDKTGQKHGGAYNDDVSHVAGAVVGGRYETLETPEASKDKLMAVLKRATAKDPVLCSVDTASGGGHEVQVVKYVPSDGVVVLRNPWGQLDRVPAAKFKASISGVNYRAGDE